MGPGDEGVEEVFAVGEGVVGAAPLQVIMDRHEGGEPEAGGGYPADEGMGLWRGLAVGAGRRRLEAMLLGQQAEPEEGELRGQFPLEGADAGSEVMHWTCLPRSICLVDLLEGMASGGGKNFNSPDISGHSNPAADSRNEGFWARLSGFSENFLSLDGHAASVRWLDWVGVLGQAQDLRREVALDRPYGRGRVHGLGTGKCQGVLVRAFLLVPWTEWKVSSRGKIPP